MKDLLDEPGELNRLNAFAGGRVLARIEYDHGDNLTLHFADGGRVQLSTLGGVEIEVIEAPAEPPSLRGQHPPTMAAVIAFLRSLPPGLVCTRRVIEGGPELISADTLDQRCRTLAGLSKIDHVLLEFNRVA